MLVACQLGLNAHSIRMAITYKATARIHARKAMARATSLTLLLVVVPCLTSHRLPTPVSLGNLMALQDVLHLVLLHHDSLHASLRPYLSGLGSSCKEACGQVRPWQRAEQLHQQEKGFVHTYRHVIQNTDKADGTPSFTALQAKHHMVLQSLPLVPKTSLCP